jgi:hypothetical protein
MGKRFKYTDGVEESDATKTALDHAQPSLVSEDNSGVVSLAIGEEFVGNFDNVEGWASISVLVIIDTAGGEEATLHLELSPNTIDIRDKFFVIGTTNGLTSVHTLSVVAKYFHVRLSADRGTTATGSIQTIYHKFRPHGLISSVNESVGTENDVQLTRSVVMGSLPDGSGFANVPVGVDGGLRTTLGNGFFNANVRLAESTPYSIVLLQSERDNIDNTGFYQNAKGIPVNGLDITFPTAAATVSIASTSAQDTVVGGTGVQRVMVQGLDINWAFIEESIPLFGNTPSVGTLEFLRVNFMFSVQAGSNGFNLGTIYCSTGAEAWNENGTPTTLVYHTIGIDRGIASNSNYTTPDNTLTVPTLYKIGTAATDSKALLHEISFQINLLGLPPWKGVSLLGFGSQQYPLHAAPSFPGRTDLWITSQADSNTPVKRATLFFGLIQRDLTQPL